MIAVSDIANSNLRQKTLEAIYRGAVDAIITINEHGLIETINPATEQLFGYQASELTGQNIKLLMPSPYHDEHDSYLANYFKSGIPKIIGLGREVIAKKKDGSTFPVHLAVSEARVGERTVFAGFIRDLTEFKDIQQQQATLGRIVEESLNEVYIFDADTFHIVQVNRGGRENLGYTRQELHRLTPFDLMPAFDEEQFRELIRPLLNGSVNKLVFSTIHQRKDRTQYDVDVHLQRSTFHSKPVFVTNVLDVTERRNAERQVEEQQEAMKAELERLVESRTRELREAQAELVTSEKFSTLGKVAGGIAHEIRNPLNAVKTSAYYLLNAKNATEAKTREHLERIDRQVTIIDNVITALADVARMPDANLRPTQIEPILREVISTSSLPENIRAALEIEEQLPKVMVDENQIVIAFRNLIRNARDAMPDGGTIRIEAVAKDNRVTISVKDTGVGIAPEDLSKVLEPLFTTKARGMGLGLSITRAIVEKNAGNIAFASKVGEGSTFSVTLRVDQ